MATKTLKTVDLEPLDRLEEKVKLLVATIGRLRADQARAADENLRLTREIDALRARLADSEQAGTELAALRDERDVIRTRVSDMLAQLEGLTL